MADRALVLLLCLSCVCIAGGDLALAQQDQDEEAAPGTEEARQGTDETETEPEEARTGPESAATEGASQPEIDEDEIAEIRDAGLRESVKVTATRVETDLMKTPVAVTVFDQETLDREGVKSVKDLAQMVPNMDIATENGQSTPIISLRGIRSTNTTELGDPSVGVHLDGIYSPRMQGILALMFDNERVEILRGPQGTLFGRNSTVGSINIVTAKPDLGAFDSRLSLQYGNYSAPELQAMINKPISETFAVRFAGRYFERDSYLDGYWDPNQYDQRSIPGVFNEAEPIAFGTDSNTDGLADCTSPGCTTRTLHSNWWADENGTELRGLVPANDADFYGNAKEWAYRVSALWEPKYKPLSWNVSFQQFRNDSAGGVDLVNCDKLEGRPNYCRDFNENGICDSVDVENSGGQPVEEFDVTNYVLNAANPTNDCSDLFPKNDTYQAVVNTPGRLDLEILYVRSRLSWDIKDNLRFVHSVGYEDQDRESAQDMEQSLNAWDQAMYFLPGTGSESWMNEFQLQSFGNQNFNWIAGANYFYEKTSTIGYFDNPISPKSFWDQPDRSTTAYAAFAQGTYSYSPEWHLTIGYRYSDETREDKGGRTYECMAEDTARCAPEVPRDQIGCNPFTGEDCQRAFDRDALNALPRNYFADPSVYSQFYRNDNKGSWSHNDWRVGLDYQRNEDTLLYAYLATGFKAGGIGDVIDTFEEFVTENPDGTVTPGRRDIRFETSHDPEEVTTLEFGLKQRLLGGKLLLKGAYFFSDYEDLQYAAVGTLGFVQKFGQLTDPVTGEPAGFGLRPEAVIAFFTENVPEARIQGLELEYDWRAWPGGRIQGYASWLDGEITDDWVVNWGYDPRSYFGLDFAQVFEEPEPVLVANLKGNDLAVSPPFKLHFTVDHAFFLEDKLMTIVPWVTTHWEDESYLTIWNVEKHTDDMDFAISDEDIRYTDDKREAWSMFHAGVRLHKGAWTAEAFVYNLTDEVVQWWGGAAEQVAKGSFSTPRNYGLRFGYQF